VSTLELSAPIIPFVFLVSFFVFNAYDANETVLFPKRRNTMNNDERDINHQPSYSKEKQNAKTGDIDTIISNLCDSLFEFALDFALNALEYTKELDEELEYTDEFKKQLDDLIVEIEEIKNVM